MPSTDLAARTDFQRWPGADNVRAVGALAVFFVHIISVLYNKQPHGVMDFCRIGTDLFLILCGCLTYQSVQSWSKGYPTFLMRRLLRIFPVFAFVLVLYVIASVALTGLSKLPVEPAAAALLILENAAIIPLAFGVTPIITVSWTLGYICLSYVVVYPLAKWTAGWHSAQRIAFWTTLTVLLYLTAGRASLLPLGVVLAEVMRQSSGRLWILALSAGALARPLYGTGLVGTALGGLGAFGLCCCLLPLKSPAPVRFLSRMSYSFYLTHGLAILLVASLPFPRPILVWLAMVGALVIAYLVYRTIEEPSSPLTARPGKSPAMPFGYTSMQNSLMMSQIRRHANNWGAAGFSRFGLTQLRRLWATRKVRLVFAPGTAYRDVRAIHENIAGQRCALIANLYFPVVHGHAFMDLNLVQARVCLGCGAVQTKPEFRSPACRTCRESTEANRTRGNLQPQRLGCGCLCGHVTNQLCWFSPRPV